MAARIPSLQGYSSRTAVLNIVKTPLAFYVLIALIVETVLGTLAATTVGQIQTISLIGLLAIFVVALLTIIRPGALIGSFSTSKCLQDICIEVSGDWREVIIPNDNSALSFVKIKYLEKANMLKLSGTKFNKKDEKSAYWESAETTISLYR